MKNSQQTKTNARSRLRSMALAYVQFAEEHPAKFQIMFQRPMKAEPSIPYTFVETGQETFTIGIEVFAEAFGGDTQKARSAALLCWSSLHGLCSLWVGQSMRLALNDEFSFSEIANTNINLMLSKLLDE